MRKLYFVVLMTLLGSGLKAMDYDFRSSEEHEWVDLGLPSGTLWATCNIGANKPEDFGDFFSWGETEPKDSYSWSTYKHCNGSENSFTKYCIDNKKGTVDGKTELRIEDDAATVNWGNNWQIPSLIQQDELINSNYTISKWTSQNNVYGLLVVSKSNGNSIFLPAAGYCWDTNHTNYGYGGCGGYWSRNLVIKQEFLYFTLGGIKTYNFDSNSNVYFQRFEGRSIRPVRASNTPSVWLVTTIMLSNATVSIQVGDSKIISADVFPSDANNKTVTWESSDEKIATVDKTGIVTAVAGGTCTITCHATDNSGVFAECIVKVMATPKFVDLGLPSGTLWATFNVGANRPEEYGDYFAWGETEPKDSYSWSTYKWMNEGQARWEQINKYTSDDNTQGSCWYDSNGTFIGDGLNELLPEDDAATANWGCGWQMPSSAQRDELCSECEWTWTTLNGVAGMRFTSKRNGNSIFLPAAGYLHGSSVISSGGLSYYWCRSLLAVHSQGAFALNIYNNGVNSDGQGYRWCGHVVRPVKSNGDVNNDGKVDLTDAIMIVYYALGQLPSGFNEAVADVNGDGNIDLTDAIVVVYKGLGAGIE